MMSSLLPHMRGVECRLDDAEDVCLDFLTKSGGAQVIAEGGVKECIEAVFDGHDFAQALGQ
jgi:hypothetical protein